MRILILLFLLPLTVLSQEVQRENIYVHTDKVLYIPGEILWFKPYMVNAATRKPTYESAIIYLEMIGKEGNAVLQCKVENTPESGGSWYIPQGIPSGAYTLTAYTLRMKEQGLAYQKDLFIINPFLEKPVTAEEATYDFQLFPEGGTLLHGVPGKIAHKLTDHGGKGRIHTVTLSENGKPLQRISVSNALGMGSFTFTPTARAAYTLTAEIDGHPVATTTFPAVQEAGILLNAAPEKDHYRVRIHSTQSTGLVLQYEGEHGRFQQRALRVEKGRDAEVLLPKKDLTAGTSCLTLLTEDQQPLAERLLFRLPSDTLTLEAELSSRSAEKRGETLLKVATPNADARFSVAVRRLDQSASREDIFSALFLQKNIIGPIEHPAYYFSRNCTESDRENLLLTQGWRKIRETPVTEERYHRIRARFTDRETHAPLAGQHALLSIPGAHIRVFPAQTDDLGIATFWVKNIYGTSSLAFKLISGLPSHVEILSPFAAHSPRKPATLPDRSEEELTTQAIYTQVENRYRPKERAAFQISPAADSIPFFGEPDARYFLDDYTRFVLMEEVLRENVKEIRVRKSRDNYEIKMLDHSQNVLFKDNPLLLFDGIPLNDANQVIHYDPLKVKKIEVVKDLFVYGDVTYSGIISFLTYRNVLEDFKLDAATTLLHYDGIPYERVFYSPRYPTAESKNSRKPDMRTLLYWNPCVQPDETLQFSTSDISGTYEIDIQGIDKNGKPGRKLSYLTVH